MAKPYMEGKGWAFRLRAGGQDIYRSGYRSQAAAERAENELLTEIHNKDAAVGKGPFRTCLASAFADYARARLPYLKGAPSDVGRINRYLRAANLPVIELEPVPRTDSSAKIYWTVKFVPQSVQTTRNSLRASEQGIPLRCSTAPTATHDDG